jgi:hypothetical protein
MSAVYGGESWKFPGVQEIPKEWSVHVTAMSGSKADGALPNSSDKYRSTAVLRQGDTDVKIRDLRDGKSYYKVSVFHGGGAPIATASLHPKKKKVCIWVYLKDGYIMTAWGSPPDCREMKDEQKILLIENWDRH